MRDNLYATQICLELSKALQGVGTSIDLIKLTGVKSELSSYEYLQSVVKDLKDRDLIIVKETNVYSTFYSRYEYIVNATLSRRGRLFVDGVMRLYTEHKSILQQEEKTQPSTVSDSTTLSGVSVNKKTGEIMSRHPLDTVHTEPKTENPVMFFTLTNTERHRHILKVCLYISERSSTQVEHTVINLHAVLNINREDCQIVADDMSNQGLITYRHVTNGWGQGAVIDAKLTSKGQDLVKRIYSTPIDSPVDTNSFAYQRDQSKDLLRRTLFDILNKTGFTWDSVKKAHDVWKQSATIDAPGGELDDYRVLRYALLEETITWNLFLFVLSLCEINLEENQLSVSVSGPGSGRSVFSSVVRASDIS